MASTDEEMIPEPTGEMVPEPTDEGSSSQAGPSTSASRPAKIFEIKKWNAVAHWKWDVNADICTICRNYNMEPCVSCEDQPKRDEQCTVTWGVCNHAFHLHCISMWLRTRNFCPLDNSVWEFQRNGQ